MREFMAICRIYKVDKGFKNHMNLRSFFVYFYYDIYYFSYNLLVLNCYRNFN